MPMGSLAGTSRQWPNRARTIAGWVVVASLVGVVSVLALANAHASGAPPTPAIGGPYSMAEGAQLSLDASATTDPEGDALTWR